jgi:GPH family glycoside/pentoside/hexuronide:cation symporter
VVPQSADALQALQLAITLIPAGILIVAILGMVMIYHPMAGRAHA